MIRVACHGVDELSVGEVRGVEAAHPKVVKHIQGALCLPGLGAGLDHHCEKHLVGLNELPSAHRMELLPCLLKLSIADQPIDENRVDHHIGHEPLVLHLPQQAEGGGDVACSHVGLHHGGIDLLIRSDELLPHLQEKTPSQLGVLLFPGSYQQRHEGTFVGLEAVQLHGVVRLHGILHAALQSLSTDQLIAVRHRGLVLQDKLCEVFSAGLHLPHTRRPLRTWMMKQGLLEALLDVRMHSSAPEVLRALPDRGDEALGRGNVGSGSSTCALHRGSSLSCSCCSLAICV
mmetsp:Transcript_35563/g.77873  ORF Transcript_35563/g.77873 Transcript_35563/m.77873 type:complete len:288 (-) Transcript_35563:132-995(-)